MVKEQREEIDDKALSTIQLCLAINVLCEALNQTITVDLASNRSLAHDKEPENKIHLKEQRFTFSWLKVHLSKNI